MNIKLNGKKFTVDEKLSLINFLKNNNIDQKNIVIEMAIIYSNVMLYY